MTSRIRFRVFGCFAAASLMVAACSSPSSETTSSTRSTTTRPGHTSTTSGRSSTSTTAPRTTTTTIAPPSTTLAPGTTGAYKVPPAAPASTPLPPPAALAPFATTTSGEGVWHPVGRRVGTKAAMYTTTLQEPGAPGVVAGIAWMDPKLLSAQLYSGSSSPGGGPWALTAPIEPAAAQTLVAAFNGGFKFPASGGGYYEYGHTVFPLVNGVGSFVIYKNGTATVADWGRDVQMGSNIAAVRQNLTLLVDHGQPASGLNPGDTSLWGSTLGGIPNVWRSGVGVTSNGALVYVAGPSLNIVQLAQLLVRAGAVRAMELDINVYWPTFSTYSPVPSSALASPFNGTDLLANMTGQPDRFFTSWWARDFVTMSARPTRSRK